MKTELLDKILELPTEESFAEFLQTYFGSIEDRSELTGLSVAELKQAEEQAFRTVRDIVQHLRSVANPETVEEDEEVETTEKSENVKINPEIKDVHIQTAIRDNIAEIIELFQTELYGDISKADLELLIEVRDNPDLTRYYPEKLNRIEDLLIEFSEYSELDEPTESGHLLFVLADEVLFILEMERSKRNAKKRQPHQDYYDLNYAVEKLLSAIFNAESTILVTADDMMDIIFLKDPYVRKEAVDTAIPVLKRLQLEWSQYNEMQINDYLKELIEIAEQVQANLE